MALHSALTAGDLHFAKVKSGLGSPNGTLAGPTYVGDLYVDTTSNAVWWRATNTGTNDWKITDNLSITGGTLTITLTGNTAVTFPLSGTLATLAGSETLTNKNLASATNVLTGATANTLVHSGTGNTTTFQDVVDTVVYRATTDTLTNKTISGSVNTITNVSLTTGVTGILPIANGGTNGASKATGFNNLSPSSSKGDLIVFDGTNNTNLAVGSNTQVLTADSTASTGVKWAPISTAGFVDTTSTQSVAGSKTFSDTVTGTIISKFGTGTQAADASNQGIVTTGTQTIAGAKTFSSAITPSGGLVGTTAVGNATAGNLGEVITSGTLTTTLSTSAITALGSITLTAGDWDITCAMTTFGSATGNYSACAISTTSAAFTGSLGIDAFYFGYSTTAQAGSATIANYRVNVSSSTQYFLNVRSDANTGNTTVGSIHARRVR